MESKNQRWTDSQLKLAFYLYCLLPFGKLHSRNPHIKEMAKIIGRTPNALAMKLVNFASLDPAIRSTGRKGLGNSSKSDKEIWDLFHHNWFKLTVECELYLQKNNFSSISDNLSAKSSFVGETRDTITKTRIGQNFFRKSVLASYEGVCCMSGVSISELLVASHIIPWSQSKENRLNPSNGLCLSAIHDRAFDKGLISIDANYNIIVSNRIKSLSSIPQLSILAKLNGKLITMPKRFYPEKEFLSWHNNNVFIK